MVIVTFGIEGQVDNGDIVDFHGFHHPAANQGRDPVTVHGNLIVQLDEGSFPILSHRKPDRYNGHAPTGSGVNVFHPIHLPQESFQGGGHKLFHFLGTGSGGIDKDICQGNDNLGFLFPWGQNEGGDPHGKGKQDQKDGKFGGQKSDTSK